ncbi:GTPase Era [Gammaproteobacteria bacterium SCGC AG-212-F23]|nr:GTPase Era [Gammaproteobacteria bacterium SCGC AG-212-F23]
MQQNNSKCGYIAIVGRPNVGKSTLLNHLIGKKISIITPKPQTTRNQILGIKTIGNVQAVYIDTPGIHYTEKRAMNRYLNRLASAVIHDADVIVFVIEALHWNREDDLVLQKLMDVKKPVILAINKVDTIKDKAKLLPFIQRIQDKFAFADIVPLSAKKSLNTSLCEEIIMNKLPENPHFFSEEQFTDKSEFFQAAEIIREKLIQATEQELPYSTTVTIDEFKQSSKRLEISAIIWVEREGQKAIVIGKGGLLLKKIGTQARKDIEKLFNKNVFLNLWVKVKNDWTDDEKALQTLGFT